MKLNINTNAVVKFTNKLEKVHKSALPVAIRGALNDAVFDVKTNTMPKQAKADFEQRQKNFFAANSKFEYAKGFDIKAMKATVGFYENRLRNQSTNYAVKDLEQQEHGGKIGSKTFIPTNQARVSGNYKRLVRANARLASLRRKGIVEASKASGVNEGQKFMKSVSFAGAGGFVLAEYNGKKILWQVNKVRPLRLSMLYSVKTGRSVNVKATYFMRDASLTTAKKMEQLYIERAKRQLGKYYGKL